MMSTNGNDVNDKLRGFCLRNWSNRSKDIVDTHSCKAKAKAETPCTSQVCLGSLMSQHGKNTAIRSTSEVLVQAKDFLEQYFTSIRRANTQAHTARWEQVQKEVACTGTYQLTETELTYGAKLAWRNSVRCIGRIQWSKLQVFDCRYVTTTSGMFEALCNHIKYSTNKGNIRSAITIFPQRTDGKHDFRVWNTQLVSYAGYKQADGTVLGDPINVEFTEVCMKLGWRGAGTRFDILPLVLSANGHDPDYFDIPSELILEVNLSHPNYDWFEDLSLKWYALPAVSGMMFDCGGIQFTAAPFNGWYMATEIGCRDLCDTHRYNQMEVIAQKMGIDTRTPVTLWKDRAMVECNLAVLHSFQMKGVTIVDHHTAAESFMKHMENEVRLRHGCPADWVWIVPPLSGSATPVFHQEMALYYLKPSYEYQDVAWKTHIWKKGRESGKGQKKSKRKFHFKQIARAVKFTSKLFGRALSRRIKATVLYATETGKSEGFAKKLGELFGHAFNAQVYCMSDYDISNIEHEALVLVVTSTFGNGDSPENGEEFAKSLYTLKINEECLQDGDSKLSMSMQTSKSFIKANSQSDMTVSKKLDRLDSWRESVNEPLLEDTFGPLSNVRFAVFALGSSAYPNFCAFGQYVDNLLLELGGERLLKMACGDDMCGQEQAFKKWAPEVFRIACETFCLDDDDALMEGANMLTDNLSAATVRFAEVEKPMDLVTAILKSHNKKLSLCKLLRRTNLLGENASNAATLKLEFESTLTYNPGDHVGVYPKNNTELVEKIIQRLSGVNDPDAPVELQVLKETHTSNGVLKQWVPHEKIPALSVRELFSRFLDITTPPSSNLLQQFADMATDAEDRDRLNILASDSAAYEDWRHWRYPNLLEVLEEFKSVRPQASLLIAQLSLLQPRFYSISSSRSIYPNQINLTVAVVTYRTQDGKGPIHYGVASNYLYEVPIGENVCLFVRSAPNFYLPTDPTRPIILVGPGTGIAPFVSFWQQRKAQAAAKTRLGSCWLFFGCRRKELDLHHAEKQLMVESGIIQRNFLALSREKGIPKTYVQDLMLKEGDELYKMVIVEKGHFYVCGDVTMAQDVFKTLKRILQKYGNMTDEEVEKYILSMRDENRYHEDIFGITLRTAEVHNRSRESARIRMASEP